MKQMKNILLWVITLFFVLSTISFITTPGALLTSILCIPCALLSCPAIHKIMRDKGKLPKKGFLIASVIILFFAAAMAQPDTLTSNADTANKTDIEEVNNISNNDADINEPNDDIIINDEITDDTVNNKQESANEEISESDKEFETEEINSDPDATVIESSDVTDMKVHFLDVGQADAIIIESDGHFMVMDAGENGDGKTVVSYLKKLGVTTIDYVIGTHPHEDHIGGLDDVISSFDVKKVILPEKTHTTNTFMDVLDAIENKGLSITVPVVGREYELGDAKFIIIAPNRGYGDNLNNWSVGIKLINGNNSFVMYGDAELVAEYDMCDNGIDLSADVLKAGHHGSDTSNSEAILKAVNPKYAVISVGINSQYGHPSREVLNRFKNLGIQYFRTDEQGTIIATSDGTDITWNTEPSTSINSGKTDLNNDKETNINTETNGKTEENGNTETNGNTEKNEVATTDNNKNIEVHITKSGEKYHSAGCQYLRKSDITTTLDKALARGLEPCSKCNPPR